jgi:anti-anti-sigma factor
VVRLPWHLDEGARLVVERALTLLRETSAPARLVLDLSAVTSVDADGLVLLERLRRRVQECGGTLALAGCSPVIWQALEATRLIYFHRGTPRGGHHPDERREP